MRGTRIALLLVLALSLVTVCVAEKKKERETTAVRMATVTVVVVKDASGKPVKNASVILRPLDPSFKLGAAQLKTSTEGKVVMELVPFGGLRIQVIAPGMQTYGEDLKVTEEQQQFTVRLKPPAEQYSIYK